MPPSIDDNTTSQIIGKGGPVDEAFKDPWLSIASPYGNDEKLLSLFLFFSSKTDGMSEAGLLICLPSDRLGQYSSIG